MGRIDDAHQAAQAQLARLTGGRLAALIAALPAAQDQTGMDTYNAAAAPLVAGAQRHSARLAAGYLALLLPASLRRSSTPPDLGRALAPVLVTTDAPVTRSPILRLWRLLAEGAEPAEAAAEASSYADALAGSDLHRAQRAGLDAAADASGATVHGWRKQIWGAGACEWCQDVAGGTYHSADSVPYHDRDRCSVQPILEAPAAPTPLELATTHVR